jgi:hypothetical protein
MKLRSPQTPPRRPQNGPQAHDLSHQLEFRQSGSGRRYPVLGPPFSAFGDNQISP